MIKALTKGTEGKPDLIILGLSRKNCELLLEGKPIHFSLEELNISGMDILIVGGESEKAIHAELSKYLKMPEPNG